MSPLMECTCGVILLISCLQIQGLGWLGLLGNIGLICQVMMFLAKLLWLTMFNGHEIHELTILPPFLCCRPTWRVPTLWVLGNTMHTMSSHLCKALYDPITFIDLQSRVVVMAIYKKWVHYWPLVANTFWELPHVLLSTSLKSPYSLPHVVLRAYPLKPLSRWFLCTLVQNSIPGLCLPFYLFLNGNTIIL